MSFERFRSTRKPTGKTQRWHNEPKLPGKRGTSHAASHAGPNRQAPRSRKSDRPCWEQLGRKTAEGQSRQTDADRENQCSSQDPWVLRPSDLDPIHEHHLGPRRKPVATQRPNIRLCLTARSWLPESSLQPRGRPYTSYGPSPEAFRRQIGPNSPPFPTFWPENPAPRGPRRWCRPLWSAGWRGPGRPRSSGAARRRRRPRGRRRAADLSGTLGDPRRRRRP